MEFFRRINRQWQLLWSVLLCLLLLSPQGAALHAHPLDHGHGESVAHAHHHAGDGAGDHTHLSRAHYAHDSSHDDFHDDVVSDIDVTPDGILKNLSGSTLVLALFVLFLLLPLSLPLLRVVQRPGEGKPSLPGRYVLSPPLRAPPLQ